MTKRVPRKIKKMAKRDGWLIGWTYTGTFYLYREVWLSRSSVMMVREIS